MNTNKKVPKSSILFECKICDYNTCRKSQYNRHITTEKHIRLIVPNKEPSYKIYNCDYGKIYKHMSSLCKHKKECYIINNSQIIHNEDSQNNISDISNNIMMEILTQNHKMQKENHELKELFMEMLKENKELKELLIDQNNNVINLAKNGSQPNITNNNTTHNKFNLNFFLNEKCKDALNIMDFVSSLTLQLTDLENVGKLGYVEGISNIFIKGLKELDIYKRPIHCSDIKREVLYVKDENKWEKDNLEKHKLRKAIHHIGNKNIKQIPEWVKQNPNCKNSDSKKNEEYLKMICNSMCGIDKNESETNMNKIISNVVKEVVIEK
jgi:hypothetical protein